MGKTRSNSYRIAALQVNAGSDWQKNLSRIMKLVSKALTRHPRLIALPENFLWRGAGRDIPKVVKESFEPMMDYFSQTAKKARTAFLLGSILELTASGTKCYNTSLLIDHRGKVIAKYRKIHLFDVNLKDLKVQESKSVQPGNKVLTAKLPQCVAGLSICYDLRFPELYRRLAPEAEILFVPANFTKKTGKTHWEVLLRARAIENLAYVVAPGQVGTHPSSGVDSYGHSLIIDPWGKVLAEGGARSEEVIWADLDLRYARQLRRIFPVFKHRKLG